MIRADMISTVGRAYLTSNIENDEYSYPKAFSAASLTFAPIQNSAGRRFEKLDIRFVKDILCLTVDVGKVTVQLTAGEQRRIGCSPMLLQVTLVALAPHTDGLLFFLGQFQIRKKIIPNLRVSTAHFFKNRLCHCLFLPFKICIFAPCALGLLSLLLHIFCLCNQIIDLLTAKDLPQEAEILQFGA